MFDEIPIADARAAHVIDAFCYCVPLMITRENLGAGFPQASCSIFDLMLFFKDEVMEDAEPVLLLADVVPEISRRVFRISRLHRIIAFVPIASALIERQKDGVVTIQLCTHLDFVLRDGKMNDSSTLVGEQHVFAARIRFDGAAQVLVFLNRVFHGLGKFGLDFGGCDRDAIDEEHEIDGTVACCLIVDLMHHAQDICIVVALCVWQALVVRVS